MGPTSARIDSRDSYRIVFDRPVTLSDGVAFLWKPPTQRDALRPDPGERPVGGKQLSYFIKKGDLELLFSLQHGLANEYLKRTSNAPVELPQWVPRTFVR
jgi:hypothetical protein